MLFAVAVSALSLASVASAQMVVKVGAEATDNGGVFQFIPPTMTASNGTTITFQFTGAPGNHSVTQSTFADPCNPAPGGFDSGWVFIPTSPALSSTPEWNLTITDDSKPIWFFCKQLIPSPHCAAGMVGAINAPTTGNTFQQFQTTAKSFKGTPNQTVNGLVGIGASASAGIGPIPSGAIAYGQATASGGGPAATNTAPAGSGTGGAPATTTSGAASSVVANSFVAMLAAALGIVLV
ncbi:hypothetical protein B0H34DRAFT_677913 [Crassisporium funariophilum]|nr:hypothetical protein B0H34DRAFT_677913 [Crassisporium funariophilum]